MDSERLTQTVLAAIAGDKDAFCLLYSEVRQSMYNIALYSLKNEQDAEDVVSEAVIDAYRSLGKLRDPLKFRAWIYRILSAKIKRAMRERYDSRNTVDIEDENLSHDPLSEFSDSIQLRQMLSSLGHTEKMIILFSVVAGYTSDEIAEILNIKSSTVRSKLSRSLAKLRSEISITEEV